MRKSAIKADGAPVWRKNEIWILERNRCKKKDRRIYTWWDCDSRCVSDEENLDRGARKRIVDGEIAAIVRHVGRATTNVRHCTRHSRIPFAREIHFCATTNSRKARDGREKRSDRDALARSPAELAATWEVSERFSRYRNLRGSESIATINQNGRSKKCFGDIERSKLSEPITAI